MAFGSYLHPDRKRSGFQTATILQQQTIWNRIPNTGHAVTPSVRNPMGVFGRFCLVGVPQ